MNNSYTSIYINYYGLPIDEDGKPLIVKGHEKACEYYCLKQLYEEDFLTGFMDGQRWGYILQEYEDGLIKAKTGMKNLSRNDIEEMVRIQYNMIQNVVNVPQYNLG